MVGARLPRTFAPRVFLALLTLEAATLLAVAAVSLRDAATEDEGAAGARRADVYYSLMLLESVFFFAAFGLFSAFQRAPALTVIHGWEWTGAVSATCAAGAWWISRWVWNVGKNKPS